MRKPLTPLLPAGPLPAPSLCPHLGVHAKAVQQLGAQLTLLGVTRADQDEAGGVADGDTLTLNGVPA